MLNLGMEPRLCYWCERDIVGAPIFSVDVTGQYCSESCVCLALLDMRTMGGEQHGIPTEEECDAVDDVAQYFDEQNEGIDAFQEREYEHEDF